MWKHYKRHFSHITIKLIILPILLEDKYLKYDKYFSPYLKNNSKPIWKRLITQQISKAKFWTLASVPEISPIGNSALILDHAVICDFVISYAMCNSFICKHFSSSLLFLRGLFRPTILKNIFQWGTFYNSETN